MRRNLIPAVLVSAALSIAAAPGVALAAAPAAIRPETLTTCASNNHGQICFEIDGSGSYVDFMAVTATWSGTYKNTHLSIYYQPNGTPRYNGATGTNPASYVKTFDHDEASGSWCGEALQGSTFLGESCVIND